ncbi:MAG: putative lipid II flippase FtsW [Acidobacteria bacterium]|nr:putative lipid II flippase FtsW [Acidobacteriota bacterium]
MPRTLKSDPVLFLATVALVCVSIVMVWSASAVLAMQKYQQPYYFLMKQLMWSGMGLAALYAGMNLDYHTFKEEKVIWAGLGAVTLCLVAVLFSPPVNNARRWFSVGGLGIQPSELAKLVAIFFIASMLERRMHRINEVGYSLLPIGLVVGVLIGLILLEPDFGTSMSLVLIAAVMVFAAGLSYVYVLGAAALLVPLAFAVMMGADYRKRRLLAFLDPWKDAQGSGFQLIQSLIAVATGGVAGKGLMQGVQKLFFLPEPHSDFIYAVISEELGLIGATAVLICFCVIAWRGLRVATKAPDTFGAFVALGLTTMISVQALVNISVVLGLLPTKGIPLPLVSAGGSSLIINLLGMGVLLNVSRHASSRA